MKEIHKGHRALNLKPLDHKLTVVYIDTLDDIYCDDEGLFNPNNHLAAYGNDDCVIVGDILIAKHNAQGEMVDLTQADIDYIGKQIWRTFDRLEREIDILFPISYPNHNK